MEEFVRRVAVMDEQGNAYSLHEFQDVAPAGTPDHPGSALRRMRRLTTALGEPVNRTTQGRYDVVETRLRLHSDDPNAP